jgi:hypothetical protein
VLRQFKALIFHFAKIDEQKRFNDRSKGFGQQPGNRRVPKSNLGYQQKKKINGCIFLSIGFKQIT